MKITINKHIHHQHHLDADLRNHFLLITKTQTKIMDELEALREQVAKLLDNQKTLQTTIDTKQDALAKAFGAFGTQITALQDQLNKPQVNPAAIAGITADLVTANAGIAAAIADVASTPEAPAAAAPADAAATPAV